MDFLTFLGTGDSMGVPRAYCDCAVCTEARTTGANRRLRSSALLDTGTAEGSLLLDCGPNWGLQMERAGLRDLRHVLITHAHYDHIGGLPEYADLCRWLGIRGKVYAAADPSPPFLPENCRNCPEKRGISVFFCEISL